MFLVRDKFDERENRIRGFLQSDPPIAVILSIVHFEWTVRRAVIALGRSPNKCIREKLKSYHGLEAYKDLWKEQVSGRRLPSVIHSWSNLRKAFELRNLLAHGVESCSEDRARERVEWALAATSELNKFVFDQGIDLSLRLPVRRNIRIDGGKIQNSAVPGGKINGI